MSEIKYAPLSDLVEEIVDNRGRTCPTSDQGIPLIATNCIKEDRIYPTHEKVRYVSDETYREWFRGHPRPGDILFVNKGTPGRVCLAPDPIDFCIAQDMVALRADNKAVCPRYLFAALRSPQVKASIDNMHVGTMIPHFKKGDFDKLLIPLPSRSDQERIGGIYCDFSLAIENNRKTNETLEAMAKALFKSWFVDFDPVRAKAEGRPTGLPAELSDLFPDSFEDSELGEIPSGWKCCPFTQLVDVISGGTPKTSVDHYWNGSIPWFSVVDAPSGSDCWVIQTEKSITHQGLSNCSSKLLPMGTTIISARGTVGKVCLAGQDMAMNQSCYGLRSQAENGEYFCFYLTKSLVEILEARAHGSVFSTITRDTLNGVTTISPSQEMVQGFSRVAGALLGGIKNNLEENRILANQRDTLLPKLISGELRIPDAEKMLEEVGV